LSWQCHRTPPFERFHWDPSYLVWRYLVDLPPAFIGVSTVGDISSSTCAPFDVSCRRNPSLKRCRPALVPRLATARFGKPAEQRSQVWQRRDRQDYGPADPRPDDAQRSQRRQSYSGNRHDRIFEYLRREAGPLSAMGWGIGLPFVKAVAESHEGSVCVDKSAALGRTFLIDIPIDARTFAKPSLSSKPRAANTASRRQRTRQSVIDVRELFGLPRQPSRVPLAMSISSPNCAGLTMCKSNPAALVCSRVSWSPQAVRATIFMRFRAASSRSALATA
jgi:hypothetical protein